MKDNIENLILSAREIRWQRILSYAKEGAVVTFSLNIPGYPKTDDIIKRVFYKIANELEEFINISEYIEDDAGIWLIGRAKFSNDSKAIKEKFIEIEENHSLGRIMDIDVYTEKGPVKRTENRKRKCIICGEDVNICRWEKRHGMEDIRRETIRRIKDYEKDKQ